MSKQTHGESGHIENLTGNQPDKPGCSGGSSPPLLTTSYELACLVWFFAFAVAIGGTIILLFL